MDWLDTKYANMLSLRLERFKRVNNNFNFRCPVCGDSKKNKTKTRGWILSDKTKSRFYCHNCAASMSFPKFLKFIDHSMYFEYVKERLMEKSGGKSAEKKPDFTVTMKKPEFVKSTGLSTLKKISALPVGHPAKVYIQSRSIPPEVHHKLFYAPKFKTWVNSVLPNKFESTEKDEPRLIIPFLDEDQNLFGFQGRSFRKNDDLKYITILLDEDKPKLFGLDTVNPDRTIYAFEGPIDSLFIPNGIASAGGRIDSNLRLTKLPKENIVIVYDNEPRNKETIQKMESAIDLGYKLVIWPESIKEKDINDLILAGHSSAAIKNLIDMNIYYDLAAKLKLTTWKKI